MAEDRGEGKVICRMTGIICPYANENGYCDSTACHNMNIVGNIIPKERPENISNSSIWVKPQSNWHTGTPTEEGRYLAVIESPLDEPFYVIATLRKEPNRMVWQGNIEPLAWQKIEPYKEKEYDKG